MRAARAIGDDGSMGHVQHSRAAVRRRRAVVGLTVAALVAAGLGYLASTIGGTSRSAVCTSSATDIRYRLDTDQARNAATITAAAVRLGLPDHAVTVALATALQESKLRNLSYGDRDSLGLFQQRPSQGWGTASQVRTPEYAATAFFIALAKIPNWEALSVADAAQEVQRSADGSAYARWEPMAQSFAIALTGERSAALSCAQVPDRDGATSTTVSDRVQAALGADALTPPNPTVGWRTAAYLVAHAAETGVDTVSYASRRWTADNGRWETRADAPTTIVTFTVRRAS